MSKCIESTVEEFHREHSDLQLRKPEFYLETGAAFARSFKVPIFISEGEAKALYALRPYHLDYPFKWK